MAKDGPSFNRKYKMADLIRHKTSSIPEAAFLKINSIFLDNIEVVGNKGFFIFGKAPRKLIAEYEQGIACVEPMEFAHVMTNLTYQAKELVKQKRVF